MTLGWDETFMSEHSFPPRPTGNVRDVMIHGALFPWQDGAPITLSITTSNDLYLPLFSVERNLRRFMLVKLAIPYDDIKQVADTDEFLASIPEEMEGRKVRLIYDPDVEDDGRVVYHEIQRPTP
jgi:hypothetical protein